MSDGSALTTRKTFKNLRLTSVCHVCGLAEGCEGNVVSDTKHYDLIVIGSGPAGRRGAIQAAKLNKRVLVIERGRRVGGVSVHTGTIPSKTLRETVLNLSGWRERGFYGP